MTRTTYDDLLTSRPTDERLALEWSTADQDRLLTDLLARTADDGLRPLTAAPRRTRRWVALGAAAAVAALAVVGGSTLLTPDERLPQAQAVQRLVATAKESDIPPGRYLHTVTTSGQAPGPQGRAKDTPTDQRVSEAWTNSAGTTWRIDTGTMDGKAYRSTHRFDLIAPDTGPFPGSLKGLRTWPTTGVALDRWVRDRMQGPPLTPAQEDDMVYEIVIDVLRLDSTPAQLRAAAVEVVAGLPGTTVSAGDGRTVLSYAGQAYKMGVVERLVFDDATSRIVEYSFRSSGMHFSERTTTVELVETLPATLRGLPSES